MLLQGLSLGALVAVLSAFSTTAFGEDTYSAVCAQAGVTCAAGRPGNIAGITQMGNSNAASVEQQAILGTYANVTSIQQSGSSNNATVDQSQWASHDAASIVQYGTNLTATIKQYGSNDGAQVAQSGNGASVTVIQFGIGAGVSVKQFK